MATRSYIGIIRPDNSIDGIYCHWDGYPNHHLPILNKHYLTSDKVNQLINLGPISELNIEIGEEHSFHSPHPNWVISYHRDRKQGDDKHYIISYPSLEDMKNKFKYDGMEYSYIYNDGKWEVYQ